MLAFIVTKLIARLADIRTHSIRQASSAAGQLPASGRFFDLEPNWMPLQTINQTMLNTTGTQSCYQTKISNPGATPSIGEVTILPFHYGHEPALTRSSRMQCSYITSWMIGQGLNACVAKPAT